MLRGGKIVNEWGKGRNGEVNLFFFFFFLKLAFFYGNKLAVKWSLFVFEEGQ